MQLEGYALVLQQGAWFIGRLNYTNRADTADGRLLSPVYEAHVRWMGDGNGNFGVLREATPVVGSTKIDELGVCPDAVVIYAERLSGKERESWANAIRECEGLIQALKTAESGLVLPPAPGGLIK